LTATISPDGKRSTIAYDKRGRPVSVTEGGLTRSMGYDAAGRITVLTNENGSQSTFRYDPVDRLTEQRGFDGRTQRYQYDLTGKLTQSEDEGLITLWHYDASDRITRRTVNGEPAEQWQYDDHGWLTEISHLSEGHRVAVHYGYDDKGRLTGERQTDGEDGPHPDGCDTDGRRADPPLPLRQPAPSGVLHADTAWRATGREPLPLRPAGTANGETGMAAGA
ncbi:RHS Repeat family protein, partial [Escherichia coli P0304799.3]